MTQDKLERLQKQVEFPINFEQQLKQADDLKVDMKGKQGLQDQPKRIVAYDLKTAEPTNAENNNLDEAMAKYYGESVQGLRLK